MATIAGQTCGMGATGVVVITSRYYGINTGHGGGYRGVGKESFIRKVVLF